MLRSALRRLWHRPAHALTVILTLGLGIALVTTQYALVHGVLLRALPFPEGEQIMHVARDDSATRPGWWRVLGHDEFVLLREQQQSFAGMAAFRSETYNLVGGEGLPLRLWGSAVSGEFFALLGVQPALGRLLDSTDEGEGQGLRAMIAWRLWQDRFGADPGVLGRSVRLNGETAEIVGVLPADFRFPHREQVWVNLRLPREATATETPGVEIVGRIRPQIEPEAAASELEGLLQARRTALGLPRDSHRPVRVQPFPLAYAGGGTMPVLYSLLAMTAFVLLLACINVGNLQAVQAAARSGEFALRGALGAGRMQLARLLLTDTLVLGLAGLLVGVLVAWIAIRLLDDISRRTLEMSGWIHFDMDLSVIAVAGLATLLAALAAAAIPLALVLRQDANTLLRTGGRGQLGGNGRSGRWFIAGQLAFACATLLIAALLAWNTIVSARATKAWDPDSLLVGRIELQGPAYGDATARTRFYEQLLDRIAQTPGVLAAAASSRDLVDAGVHHPFEVEGEVYPRERDRPNAYLEVVTRDYFQVVDEGALRGRVFGPGDRADSTPVAVVNASLAERHWPGQDPIGRRVRLSADDPWATVVGVVPDLNLEGVGNPGPGAGFYLLQDQIGWGWLELLVRTEGDPAALIDPVRRAVAEVDPDQPVHTILSLDERSHRRTAGMRLVATMAGIFALVAVFLSALGVYGVLAQHTRHSVRELGLRLALGASPRGIVGLMMRRYQPAVLIGIVAGAGLGQTLLGPLARVMPHGAGDWTIHVGVPVALAVAALLASLGPALRAGAVDPMVALRSD